MGYIGQGHESWVVEVVCPQPHEPAWANTRKCGEHTWLAQSKHVPRAAACDVALHPVELQQLRPHEVLDGLRHDVSGRGVGGDKAHLVAAGECGYYGD